MKLDKKILEIKGGSFRTFATDPDVFTFSAASCADTLYESDAFSHFVSNNPDLVIQLGDMHYSGASGLTSGMFQEAYHEVFKLITHRKLYENWPIEYIMDDHDVG